MDHRVTVTDSGGVAYAHQTVAGAAPASPGTARWTVEWTAPVGGDGAPGAVLVHVAANAANDDASEFGDFIYADSARVAGPD